MQLTHTLAALALVATACEGGSSFGTDPNAWNPLGTPVDAAAFVPGDGGVVSDSRCRELPAHDETVVRSSTGAVSHASGQPCLEGCHQAGGEAQSVFAVGGTVVRAQGSYIAAESGFVGVAGVRLDVDACGNFYAKEDELAGSITSTPPYVASPTLRSMSKSLRSAKNPGNCNQSTCHDFSRPLRWGIYY